MFVIQGSDKSLFSDGPSFCDQAVAKLVVESDTGKINLNISLDIVREKCTGIFYIVGSEGFQQMH